MVNSFDAKRAGRHYDKYEICRDKSVIAFGIMFVVGMLAIGGWLTMATAGLGRWEIPMVTTLVVPLIFSKFVGHWSSARLQYAGYIAWRTDFGHKYDTGKYARPGVIC